MEFPRVAVILVNWNGYHDTVDCLESIKNLSYPNYFVVVVDNGSEDESEIKLRKSYPQHTVLQSGANLGFASASNLGIRYALEKNTDSILLLNNDTKIEPNMVTELVKTSGSDEKIGMTSGKIYFINPPDKLWSYGGYFNVNTGEAKHFLSEKEASHPLKPPLYLYLPACLLLIKRECIERVGLLSENFFHLGEDVDYCLRAQRNGWKLVLNPRAVVYHKSSASMAHLSPIYNYYNQRNGLFLIREYQLKNQSVWKKIRNFLAIVGRFSIMPFCVSQKRLFFKNIFFIFMAANDFFHNRSGKRFNG